MRRVIVLLLSAVLVVPLALVTAAPAAAIPPNIPSASTAAARLAALTVAAEMNHDSYDREAFPHWITISGTCNTREEVLKRDGTGVVTNASDSPWA